MQYYSKIEQRNNKNLKNWDIYKFISSFHNLLNFKMLKKILSWLSIQKRHKTIQLYQLGLLFSRIKIAKKIR